MDVIFNSIISIPLEGASRDEDSLNCPSVAHKPLSIDNMRQYGGIKWVFKSQESDCLVFFKLLTN